MAFFDISIPETQDPRPAELRAGESKLKKHHLVSADGSVITTSSKSVEMRVGITEKDAETFLLPQMRCR